MSFNELAPEKQAEIKRLSALPGSTINSICKAVGTTRNTVLKHALLSFKVRNRHKQLNTRF